MLNSQFVETGGRTLFVSFSPSYAGGKFLFYRFRNAGLADCLYFNDESNSFYLEHIAEIVEAVDQAVGRKRYEKLVFVGFSAGAFMACHAASRVDYEGPVAVHAFSPHVNLAALHSSAWRELRESWDLTKYSLSSVPDGAKSVPQVSLYLSVDSARDSLHVRDSLALDKSHLRIHYLNCGHNTIIVLGKDYSAALADLCDGRFRVARAWNATPRQLVDCLLLADLYVHEMEGRLAPQHYLLREPHTHAAEFRYWYARQLARCCRFDEALRWGWAAIIGALPDCPESYFETLGNIAFDNGFGVDALKAYRLIKTPTETISKRIVCLAQIHE